MLLLISVYIFGQLKISVLEQYIQFIIFENCMIDTFFYFGSYVSLKLQNHTGNNTWNNKTKAVYWWIKNRGQLHLAEEMQLLHLSKLLGMKLSWAWAALWLADWLVLPQDSCSQMGDISCNPGTISSSAVKISPCEATEAYYYTILEANLIWSNKLISLTICKRDLQGQCQENESQYQSLSHLFHTHSLSLSSAIFFSPYNFKLHQWLQ